MFHTQRVKFVRVYELIHKESFESFAQMSEFAEAVIIFFFFLNHEVCSEALSKYQLGTRCGIRLKILLSLQG